MSIGGPHEVLPPHGTDTAGALLVSAGDNPQRLRSEAAFAHHCGVAPIDASSGLTIRKRLNRGGDRTANQALWRIVMVRMAALREAHADDGGAPQNSLPADYTASVRATTGPRLRLAPPLPAVARHRGDGRLRVSCAALRGRWRRA